MNTKGPKVHTIKGEAQQRAISSPLRLEILGYFSAGRPLSVREIAERMGRPATAIHYHVRLLEQSGLLTKTGERRHGRRREAEYSMVAEAIAVLGRNEPSDESEQTLALKTAASSFRMAERSWMKHCPWPRRPVWPTGKRPDDYTWPVAASPTI